MKTTNATHQPAAMPATARSYVAGIIVLGLPILLWSLYQFLPSLSRGWGYLAIATALCSFFPVRLPVNLKRAGSITISIGDCFVFAGLLLYGPAAAVVIAAIEATVSYLKAGSFSWVRFAFNIAQLSLVSFVVGHVFYQLQAASPPLQMDQVSVPLLLVLLGCALLYGLLNTGIISAAMALVAQKPLFPLIKSNFICLSPTNMLNASASLLLFLYFEPPELAMAVALIFLTVSAFYAREVKLTVD